MIGYNIVQDFLHLHYGYGTIDAGEGETGGSADLNPQPLDQRSRNPIMELVGLGVGECPFQTAVVDAVAHAPSARPGVGELIRQFDILDNVACNVADDLHDVVLMEVMDISSACVASSG